MESYASKEPSQSKQQSTTQFLEAFHKDQPKPLQNCIILAAGPKNLFINKEFVLKVENALLNQNAKLTRIGDGEAKLSKSEVFNLYHLVNDSRERLLIFIIAHGEVLENKYLLELEADSPTEIKSFFENLKISGNAVDIFSIACNGSGASNAFIESRLPDIGSTFVVLSGEDQFTQEKDSNVMMDALLKENLTNGNISAEKLLLIYLINLKQKITPDIISEADPISLEDKFIEHLGVSFTDNERALILDQLGNFVSRSKLSFLIEKIEQSKLPASIDDDEYGLALAICHIAYKVKMLALEQTQTTENIFYHLSNDEISELMGNPVFDPNFLSKQSTNTLRYALNIDGPAPVITYGEIQNYRHPLIYISNKINDSFFDPELVKVAPYELGKLPKNLAGYYIVAVALSHPGINPEKEIFYETGIHYYVQNHNGFFSKRNQTSLEQLCNEKDLPILPEKACLAEIKNGMTFSSNFEGYLYFKNSHKRTPEMAKDWHEPCKPVNGSRLLT